MMQQTFRQPRHLLMRATAIHQPLAFTLFVMLLTIIAALIGLLADPSVITGTPAWLKPLKFAISISIYSATLIWLLSFVQGYRRIVRIVAWVIATASLIEMALIVVQVIRGTTSHFNVSTRFDTAVWGIMAVSIVSLWTATLILGIVLLRQRFLDPAFAWALRLGLFISLIGMGVAFFMTTPTSAQLTTAKAGNGLPISGAHSVGVADGGPGLPIVGWSTVGGDLRVPHFVGLHGLQLLPLFGWLVVRYGTRLRPAARTALVWIAGLGYLGLVGLLTWQALHGQSIVHPDARTLAVLAALIGGIILAVAGVLFAARRATPVTYSVIGDSVHSTG